MTEDDLTAVREQTRQFREAMAGRLGYEEMEEQQADNTDDLCDALETETARADRMTALLEKAVLFLLTPTTYLEGQAGNWYLTQSVPDVDGTLELYGLLANGTWALTYDGRMYAFPSAEAAVAVWDQAEELKP